MYDSNVGISYKQKRKDRKMKRKILCILCVSIILSMALIPVSATVSPFLVDGAPSVYVSSDADIPSAAQNNKNNCKNEQYITTEMIESHAGYLAAKEARRLFLENNVTNNRSVLEPIVYASVMLIQFPQERDYYCGYASLQSVECFEGNIKEQTDIAASAWRGNDALPWYVGGDSSSDASDWTNYPAATYLSSLYSHPYRPYSINFGNFGLSDFVDILDEVVWYQERPVMACGTSYSDNRNDSKLPGYPNSNISHWVVINGLSFDVGAQTYINVRFADPAKSDVINWSNSISEYGNVTPKKMHGFIGWRGIIK